MIRRLFCLGFLSAIVCLGAAESAHRSILDGTGPALIDAQGKPVEAKRLAAKKYLFVYFSAHWCPPCRRFTPKLVEFYNSRVKDGDFDLLFVSSDEDAAALGEYMKGASMPWAAVRFGDPAIAALKERFKVSGIPCLVLLDDKDQVVASSFDDQGEYQGPDVALEKWLELHPK